MQFGLFYEWPNPNLRDWKTLFEEGVEHVRGAEDMLRVAELKVEELLGPDEDPVTRPLEDDPE